MHKKYFYLSLTCATLLLSPLALAQQRPRPTPGTAPNAAQTSAAPFTIANVKNNTITTLRNLRPGTKMLVNLGASAEALQADPAAYRALQRWIENGGVMTVYSDAATLFGFTLQKARPGNHQQGGQLFGRAVSAVPFGSEPLLWKIPARAAQTPRAAGAATDDTNEIDLPLIDGAQRRRQRGNRLSIEDPTTFGEMTVFYNLEEGDSLLVSHPSAVPLLRVTDLAQPQTQLFASAVASYGNGWIVFTPRHIEAQRTQGEQFLYNLSAMAADPPLPVAISAITSTAESIANGTPNYAALLSELQNRLGGKTTSRGAAPTNADGAADNDADNGEGDETAEITPAATSADTAKLMPATLPVSRALATAMLSALQAASSATPPENARERVASAVALWMLRATIQRINVPLDEDLDPEEQPAAKAMQWLDMASEVAPEARDVFFWQGVFQAQNAFNPFVSSRQRAAAYAAATQAWNQAATATPLLAVRTGAVNTNRNNDANNAQDGEIPTPARPPLGTGFGEPTPPLLAEWARQAQQAATTTAMEPPVTQVVRGIVIRHAGDDPTLRLALPTLQRMQSLTTQFGWVIPREEVLIFPNESALAAYSRRLGPLEAGETPLASSFGRYGRVLGNRILMISMPSQPIRLPGNPPRIIQAGTAAASVIARLHADLLLNTLSEGGTPVPGWMRLGMMALADKAATSDGDTNQFPPQALLEAGAANQLLSPNDFGSVRFDINQTNLADLQAESLMNYFYQVFGPGAVMETVQRLGSGQSNDEALGATTEMTEDEFFSAWFNALRDLDG